MARPKTKTPEQIKATNAANSLRYYYRNREARAAYAADRRKTADPRRKEWSVKWERKRRGIPEPTYPCPSACELCSNPPGKQSLHADHNHITGKFRGWLCFRCNSALGLLRDSSDLCVAAASYLRREELS